MANKETPEIQHNSTKGAAILTKKEVIQSMKKRKKATESVRKYLRDN